jgi:hypothetical protein
MRIIIIIASCPVGTAVALSQEVKQQRREADHSSPSSAEVKSVGAILTVSHMSS